MQRRCCRCAALARSVVRRAPAAAPSLRSILLLQRRETAGCNEDNTELCMFPARLVAVDVGEEPPVLQLLVVVAGDADLARGLDGVVRELAAEGVEEGAAQGERTDGGKRGAVRRCAALDDGAMMGPQAVRSSEKLWEEWAPPVGQRTSFRSQSAQGCRASPRAARCRSRLREEQRSSGSQERWIAWGTPCDKTQAQGKM